MKFLKYLIIISSLMISLIPNVLAIHYEECDEFGNCYYPEDELIGGEDFGSPMGPMGPMGFGEGEGDGPMAPIFVGPTNYYQPLMPEATCDWLLTDLPNDIPQNTFILALHGTSPNDIWAGSSTVAPSRIYHFDGTSWTIARSEATTSTESVYAISTNDVWFGGVASPTNTPLRHWDGVAFTGYVAPSSTSGTTRGIYGAVSNDVWATTTISTSAGGIKSSYVFHWDGASWTRQVVETRPAANAIAVFKAIFGFASDNIYMGGDINNVMPVIRHWGGVSWVNETLPVGNFRVNQIWGSSPTDIYASLTTNGQPVGRIIHSTGNGIWTSVYDTSVMQINGIYGAAFDNVFAAYGAKILHYDGDVWADVWSSGETVPGSYQGEAISMGHIWVYNETKIYISTINVAAQNGGILSLVCNYRPTSNAGPDQNNLFIGTTVQLNGCSSSDPELDPLLYLWTQLTGPTVLLSDATICNPVFTMPNRSVSFNLNVNDTYLDDNDSVSILQPCYITKIDDRNFFNLGMALIPVIIACAIIFYIFGSKEEDNVPGGLVWLAIIIVAMVFLSLLRDGNIILCNL